MNSALIDIQHLNKTYIVGEQPLQVLKDINLQIKQGDYLAIMGPSGSGKSTLLNMIGLLDRADNGEYLLKQQATLTINEEQRAALRRAHIGFIFQNFHLIPRLSAAENAELPLMLAGMARKQRRAKVQQVFRRLGIAERADHLPKQLSGGQMQRVAIARAMVLEPQILLADEPTGNLDQKSGREVVELLEELNRQGITLIMVTHDQQLAKRAPRQLTMVDGEITEDTQQTQQSRQQQDAL
ncbi:ABC transporter ATP-binding protein [Thalassotalea sp. ND16A]|uniref:ABC transporter ATP-binding protein n=1 Tax=Thalassotalea sp. ND16A TaxID=1535422 RepID=UPI00051DFE36|nr:ABC transporter ATP-binding protein [Thalassotalea sp. ND16A]KGJ91077.1 Phosphonate-transporting ATPase [Thalassotalea sp. ND16A]